MPMTHYHSEQRTPLQIRVMDGDGFTLPSPEGEVSIRDAGDGDGEEEEDDGGDDDGSQNDDDDEE
jgi:hypothetical protein